MILFNRLPTPIRLVVDSLETPDQKSMALYGATVIAGSLMPHVKINYDNKENYPALYLLISFPPASKGNIALLARLLSKISREQQNANSQAMKAYLLQMKKYERAIKKGEAASLPEKPRTPLLMIPANITSAKLTEQLQENGPDVMGLIFETETDALTNMMGSKFGVDNSMMLRKMYHHEPISVMRKNNGEHFDVQSPKMAIVLTGTPSQNPKLFNSNQDGLVSRFMMITGKSSLAWKDVKPCDACRPLEEDFDKHAELYYQMYKFFQQLPLEVKLSEAQWGLLNARGTIWMKKCVEEYGQNAVSLAKRHANMIARIAVIFTALRCYEKKTTDTLAVCTDEDYATAETLAEHSFQNSLELFSQFPGEDGMGNQELLEFYQLLPMEFSRKELEPLTKKLKTSMRSLERMIKSLVELDWLVRVKKGLYKKQYVSDLSDGGIHDEEPKIDDNERH